MARNSTQAGRMLKELGASCPYTALGRKAIRVAKGEPLCQERTNDLESRLQRRIKLGRNIALIGLFCPIFWLSLFSGARVQTVYFNAVHSGIVILIGMAIMAQGTLALKKRNPVASQERNSSPSV